MAEADVYAAAALSRPMRSQLEANGVKQVLTKLGESRETRAVVLTLANLGYRRTSRDKGGNGHAPHLALPTQH